MSRKKNLSERGRLLVSKNGDLFDWIEWGFF
jgi:hypothetical protein